MEQTGVMRNLLLRNNSKGEWMVCLSVTDALPEVFTLLDELKAAFPQIHTLLYTINTKRNDTISDLDIFVHSGAGFIEEEMEGLRFRIGPKSFYQTNSEQAYELYKHTRAFAGITKDDVVYDLYTGTGTIALFVAGMAKKVVGVEYVPEAVADAKINAEVNGVDNVSFFAGDMKDVLVEGFFETHGKPDVIITDPPRAGMHDDVTKRLFESGARRIVYVSCNPATQARDLTLLDQAYSVVAVQPVDMFPQTTHVENIVVLDRKN
jgi:23S rRNA (uracil1939-C5)-methyltransferase